MSIQKTEALVLKRWDFRETSLLAEFFTRDFGKISGVLKGIRTEPEKFASCVEVFSFNEIIFYPKRSSSLHLVSGCDIKDNFDLLRQNLSRFSIGCMMMELISELMAVEDKNEDIFLLVLSCLRELAINENPEKIATIFKIKLLALSGFKPHFDSCVSCADRILGQAKFSLGLGGLLCQRCQHKDLSARAIFRGTVATILHIEKNDLKNNLSLGMNPQIKRELGQVLDSFLNFHLGKALKSQKVMERMAG